MELWMEPTMSSGTAKDFEDYARDCVRLAEQVDSPELRKSYFNRRASGCTPS
jgi:hypothetical protein